jgi:hypothetical protein
MRMSFPRVLTLALATIALTSLPACGHDIESPAPSSAAVQPNVVCAEQLTTTVTLTGDAFTPMPSKSLQKPERLILPSVDLKMSQDLAGVAANGGALRVPDDPADPTNSRVKWQSEQQMSFAVVPGFLTPGLYDVVVTNPDEKHAATFTGGLVAVPRPTLTGPVPDFLCDAEHDETVTVNGKDILQVGTALPTVTMGGKSFPVTKVDGCSALVGNDATRQVQRCTSATFTIPKGTFEPGAYDVTLTNPDPAGCVSSDKISITVVPPPKVAKVAADLVCDAQGDQTMTVTGTGFIEFGTTQPTVSVGTQTFKPTKVDGCTTVPGTFTEGPVSSCTSITFVLPKGTFTEGDYDVVVNNPPPADCKSLETVKLHVAPPPTIANVKPVEICDAQNLQIVTINGSGFLEIGTTLPSVTIGTSKLVPTSATGCTPIMGTFVEGAVQTCTGLVVSVPKGTFVAGSYPLTVQNPDPAGCSSTDMVSLAIANPPVVTGSAPATICQGGGNINVNGSGFQSAATLTLTATGQPTMNSASSTVNAAGTQIAATFGGTGAPPGTKYDINVDNGDGCTDVAPHQQVTVVTGPVAFFADPEIVYAGVNTRVTIYLTSLSGLPTVTMVPTGATTPVTPLATSLVPGHPNRVQVLIPTGTAPGSYDLHLVDATGCPTVLPSAIRVTNTLTVTLKSVIPPFGWTNSETSVSILRDKAAAAPANAPFIATPRVFLNPVAGGAAAISVPLASVSFVDAATLTAIVPKNEPIGVYDVIVVNPDGTVGLLKNGFTVQTAQPPTISSVTPSSIVDTTGQNVVVAGASFTGSTVSLSCVDAMGAPLAAPSVTSGAVACGASGCTQPATINGSALPIGALCVLRVTNTDGSYFDYSAIGVTGPALNLPGTHAGTNMNVGRRALVASSGNATPSARFVYAIGGDGGAAMANAPFTSTEVASVDLFGNLGSWALQPASQLKTARAFAASATIGRYVYVAGGTDGTSALATVERAMILNPSEVPQLDVNDLVPATTGLAPGYWLYRVSASFSAADLDNPAGESLPSDEFIVKVPSFTGKKIQLILSWQAPADSLGAPLPNVAGYNVYRTPLVNGVSGGEVLLATVPAATLTYTDDGSATPGTQKPLAIGSTGKWASLASMATARKGAAGAWGFDPVTPNKAYFYSLLGVGTTGPALTSYEYLPVTLQANGHQTTGAWATGASTVAQGRWQLGAWVADSTVSSTIAAGSTYVFLGGGLDAAGTAANAVDAGKISAGGDLGTLATTPKDFTSNSAGYGVCAANGQLFAFGGANGAPSGGAKSAGLVAPAPTLAVNSWNNEGITLVNSRYLMGSSVQSAFIFLVGGQTATSAASTSTELVIW